jgi:hypothetical protein
MSRELSRFNRLRAESSDDRHLQSHHPRDVRGLSREKREALKASEHIDGWLRETYFGQVLAGHSRAIRVFDTFPLVRDDGNVLYCLALAGAFADSECSILTT